MVAEALGQADLLFFLRYHAVQQREERIEGYVLLSLKPYIICEGLYSVLISCYGNKIFPILLIADRFVEGNTQLIHYNHLFLWQQH